MSKIEVAVVIIGVAVAILITLVTFGYLDIDTAVPIFLVLFFAAFVVGVIRRHQG